MDNQAKDKGKLLEQLKIDRQSLPEPTKITLKKGILIAIISTIMGAIFASYFLLPSLSLFDNKFLSDAKQFDTKQLLDKDPKSPRSTLEVANSPSQQNTESDKQLQDSKSGGAESILNASGYITARRMATVSAEIMGLIKAVNVEEGMEVNEGQILARLDDTLARVNLNLAKAQIEALIARQHSAQASLAEAKRQYQRIINNQYSSEAERSQARTTLDTSQANLNNATAAIKVAKIEVTRQQERLDDHTIRAPFSGVVTMKNAQPGEIVAPTSAGGGFTRTGICTIVDMDSLEIEVDVNESFIGRVFPEQKVTAQLDAYSSWTIPATVVAIIPTADRAKATVKVRIKIEIKDSRILPDMGVKVAFLKSE